MSTTYLEPYNIGHRSGTSITYSGGTRMFRQYYSHGNGTATFRLGRVRKHYWGAGVVDIRIWRTYYSGSEFGHYIMHGHMRPTHGQYTSVQTIVSGGPVPYWGAIVNPSGTEEGYADFYFDADSYLNYMVEIKCQGFDIAGSTTQGYTDNMYNWGSTNLCWINA